MPPFQTSEALRPQAGFPGQMADGSEWNAISGFVTHANARAGHPVSYGPTERTFVAVAQGTRFAGLLQHHLTEVVEGVFNQNAMAGAIDEGVMFVRPGGVCTRGNPVFFNPAANGGEGGYSNAVGFVIPGAEFLNSATATDPVVQVKLRKVPGTAAFAAPAA